MIFSQTFGNARREISIEKPRYVLKGKIDLLVRRNNEYKIFDFKTEKKPDDFIPKHYSRQLHIYAYILKEVYGICPNKIKLYIVLDWRTRYG